MNRKNHSELEELADLLVYISTLQLRSVKEAS